MDWIEANNPPGPIAHPMKMGGYLVWRLYPERKVLVDGRLEVYGADRLRQLPRGVRGVLSMKARASGAAATEILPPKFGENDGGRKRLTRPHAIEQPP